MPSDHGSSTLCFTRKFLGSCWLHEALIPLLFVS